VNPGALATALVLCLIEEIAVFTELDIAVMIYGALICLRPWSQVNGVDLFW
jgi:hypothetical protein